MSIKRYRIGHYGGAELIIDIDFSIVTADMLHGMNHFWWDCDEYLEEAHGDQLKAVLMRLAQVCWREGMAGEWTTDGLITALSELEGWPLFEGSMGWKIISYYVPDFDICDITVGEVSVPDEVG